MAFSKTNELTHAARLHASVLVAGVLWPLLCYGTFLLLSEERAAWLVREDGLFETQTAICFLLCSVIFFGLFVRRSHNLFFLGLALVFLFGFGEEISWGQRIFDYPTPEWLRKHNLQEEANIHNLRIFSASKSHHGGSFQIGKFITLSRLFAIFWGMYCVVIPLAARWSQTVQARLSRMRFPIVPLHIGGLFVYTYLVFKVAESSFLDHREHFLVEIKESNLALLFLLVAVWQLRHFESVSD